jgi:hypothetical protein
LLRSSIKGASAAFLLLLPVPGVAAANPGAGNQPSSARQEIRERFELSGPTSVTVSGIGGPVTVETSGGDAAAEVHIVRTAASERELQCYRTAVTHKPGNITVQHEQFSSRPGCNSIRSRQAVRLKLPRSVNLHLSTIGGPVTVGPMDGLLRLDSIAGHVTVAEARSAEMNSLAQGLSLTLPHLASRGVRISSVVGKVEINFRAGANADVMVDSVVGTVGSDWPARSGGRDRVYRIGSGGNTVLVSSVVGSVRLRRL